MEDLEKRISEVVTQKMNDGTIEKLIEQHLSKAIDQALSDIFGYSGEARKLLKQKFDDVMCPAIERHDFNQYVVKLDSVLSDIINNTRLAENKQILGNFQYLMKDEDIKEIKLSEIFEKYCEYVSKYVDTSELEVYTDDEAHYEMVEVNMEVEKGSSIFSDRYSITFNCEKDESLQMGIELYKSYNSKYMISRIINHEGSLLDIPSLAKLSNFEVFLLSLDRNFAYIDIDCDDMSEEVEVEAEPEASWS